MLLGVFILSIYEKILPFENWILSYLVIPFTMTWNFILSSLILSPQKVETETHNTENNIDNVITQ